MKGNCGNMGVNKKEKPGEKKMETEKNNFWKENKELWFSFLLCGLSMYIFCVSSVRMYEKESTLLTGDVLKQYIPALRAFVRSIWQGAGITYSWDLFCGMNATEFYGTYVGGSFVNLIYLLFPSMDPEVFLQIAFSLKVAMAGLCFSFFCKKFWKMQGIGVIFFSLFYALCSFQFSINVINYIWMDAIYMLPLILALIVMLFEEGKWFPLVPAYFYLFFCNFYMGYVVGCFSALFFLGYFFLYKGLCKKNLGIPMQFAVSVIWAAALAAFSLLPIGLFLLHHTPADTTVADTSLVQQNILLLLSRFSFGIEVSNFVKLPHLYCGIPVILLVGVFFGSREIGKKEKILFGSLLGIMLLSTMVLPLYMFWHGFDNPDSWYHRFSYTIAFLCVSMAVRAVRELWKLQPKKILLIGVLEVLVMTGINVYGCYANRHQEMQRAVYSSIIAVCWILFAVVLTILKEDKRRRVAILAVLLACVEVISNGCLTDRFFQNGSQRKIWEEENQLIMDADQEDHSFYRVDFQNEYNYSQDTYFGHKGISDFWSYENYPLKNTLGNLGMFTSPRLMRSMGLNSMTQLLLGVKYSRRTSGATEYERSGVSGFMYPRYLSLGFMVSENVENISFQTGEGSSNREYFPLGENTEENMVMVENVFENCNRLAGAMTGGTTQIFVRVPAEKIAIESHGVELGREGEDYILSAQLSDDETKWIDFKVSEVEDQVYVAFEGNNTIYSSDLPWIYDYYNPLDMGVVGVRYTKPLDIVNSQYVCTVAMARGTTLDTISCKEIQFYSENQEGLQQLYDQLSQNQLDIMDYKNGYVHGKVTTGEGQKLLFTSIPYDEGWKVKRVNADGSKELLPTCSLLDEAFLGVRLPGEGVYELEMTYTPEGMVPGLIISGVAFAAFLCTLLLLKKRKTSQKSEEISTEEVS